MAKADAIVEATAPRAFQRRLGDKRAPAICGLDRGSNLSPPKEKQKWLAEGYLNSKSITAPQRGSWCHQTKPLIWSAVIGIAVVERWASPNKCLAQMNKSGDGGQSY